MKRNKRLLLASIAAMGVVALGTGAVSTLAWFEAKQSASVTSLSGNTDSTIRVTDQASSQDLNIQLSLQWSGLDTAVQLTSTGADDQVPGTTYVIDQNGNPVEATGQASLVKYGTGSLIATPVAASASTDSTIKKYDGSAWVSTTEADRYLLNGKQFDLYVAGDDQLRIAVTLTACAKGGSTANPDYVADAKVKLATVTITATAAGAVTFTYANVEGAFKTVTNAAQFYYSVSPKSTNSTANESTTAAYGTLTASLS